MVGASQNSQYIKVHDLLTGLQTAYRPPDQGKSSTQILLSGVAPTLLFLISEGSFYIADLS